MAESPGSRIAPITQREDIITLQVGNQRFYIRADILCKAAHFFEGLIFSSASAAMKAPARTTDGAFIVQANPDVFKHVIHFCLFSTYPLFWERGGFQYGLYAQLLSQARYFQVSNLVAWIDAKEFEKVVQKTFDHSSSNALEDMRHTVNGATDRSLQYLRIQQRVWNCPRGLAVHKGPYVSGHTDRCGKDCAKKGEGCWSDAEVSFWQQKKVFWSSVARSVSYSRALPKKCGSAPFIHLPSRETPLTPYDIGLQVGCGRADNEGRLGGIGLP